VPPLAVPTELCKRYMDAAEISYFKGKPMLISNPHVFFEIMSILQCALYTFLYTYDMEPHSFESFSH